MHTQISIREFRIGDLAAVCRINAESAPGVALLTSTDLRCLTANATFAWVAAAGHDIAGYAIGFTGAAIYDGEEFAWFTKHRRNFFYVDQIAMATSLRGRGLGSLLYSEVERWAARRLCRSLTCEVNLDPPNARSLAFHQLHDFIEVGRMKTKDGRYAALLEKDIRSIR